MNTNRLVIMLLLVLLFLPYIPSGCGADDASSDGSTNGMDPIRVAMYVADGDELWVQNIFQYEWSVHGKTYSFTPTIIYYEDVLGYGPHPLTKDNFDVLVIGASARSYTIHGLSETWKQKIRDFVASGGGYIGMCAGSILASCGVEDPTSVFHHLINHNCLSISNVYIDEDYFGELQYVLKNGFNFEKWTQPDNKTAGYVDVNCSVVNSPVHPILSDFNQKYCVLTYAGGPGMMVADVDDLLISGLSPLLTYNEELMNTKPLHFYRYSSSGWTIWKNVTTDLLGTYAGVCNSYGNGKVVLFGPHPELIVTVNGTIQEYLDRGLNLYVPRMFSPPQYVFSYIGDMASFTNQWMMRRSAAWSVGVPDEELPPVDDLKITVVRPWTFTKGLYINDNGYTENFTYFFVTTPKIREKDHVSVVIGDLTVVAYTQHCDIDMKVDFYIDDRFIRSLEPSYTDPQLQGIAYQTMITEPLVGLHEIKFSVEGKQGNKAWDSVTALFLNV